VPHVQSDKSVLTTTLLADSDINDQIVKLHSLIDQPACFEFTDVSYFGVVNFLPRNTLTLVQLRQCCQSRLMYWCPLSTMLIPHRKLEKGNCFGVLTQYKFLIPRDGWDATIFTHVLHSLCCAYGENPACIKSIPTFSPMTNLNRLP